MPLRSAEGMAQHALAEMLNAVVPLRAGFQMTIDAAGTEEVTAVVIVRNQHSFVRIAWGVDGRYFYGMGPIVDGKVPDLCTGQPLSQYGLDWFVQLASEGVQREVRELLAAAGSSAHAGVQTLIACAARFLEGDWTRRGELQQMVDSTCPPFPVSPRHQSCVLLDFELVPNRIALETLVARIREHFPSSEITAEDWYANRRQQAKASLDRFHSAGWAMTDDIVNTVDRAAARHLPTRRMRLAGSAGGELDARVSLEGILAYSAVPVARETTDRLLACIQSLDIQVKLKILHTPEENAP